MFIADINPVLSELGRDLKKNTALGHLRRRFYTLSRICFDMRTEVFPYSKSAINRYSKESSCIRRCLTQFDHMFKQSLSKSSVRYVPLTPPLQTVPATTFSLVNHSKLVYEVQNLSCCPIVSSVCGLHTL